MTPHTEKSLRQAARFLWHTLRTPAAYTYRGHRTDDLLIPCWGLRAGLTLDKELWGDCSRPSVRSRITGRGQRQVRWEYQGAIGEWYDVTTRHSSRHLYCVLAEAYDAFEAVAV